VHQTQRRGTHRQRAGPVQVGPQGLVGLLPFEPVHAHRQHVGQGRPGVAAGPETLKAAEHHQARPAVDAIGQIAQFVVLKGRRIDIAQNVNSYLPGLNRSAQIGRADPGIARVDPHVIEPISGEEPSARRMNFASTRSAPSKYSSSARP